MSTTYRAAYWISEDRQSTVRLTTEEQAALSDQDLMAAAKNEAESACLEIGDGSIEIGNWAE